MRVKLVVGGLWAAQAVCALGGCGTYSSLTPGAQTVRVSTMRPAGNCKSLGTVTGKGGGASGAWVSNEDLIKYAVTDARNQAAKLGATDLVYSGPSMGGNSGTTTSAMVIAEALKCNGAEVASGPAAAAAPAATVAPAAPAAAAIAGCQFDTQCKGDRVCTNGACVAPTPAGPKPEGAAASSTPPASAPSQ